MSEINVRDSACRHDEPRWRGRIRTTGAQVDEGVLAKSGADCLSLRCDDASAGARKAAAAQIIARAVTT